MLNKLKEQLKNKANSEVQKMYTMKKKHFKKTNHVLVVPVNETGCFAV